MARAGGSTGADSAVSREERAAACSLEAADAARQGDVFRAICRRSLLEVQRDEGRVAFRFRDDDGVRRELEDYVAVESQCCGFLGFDLRRDDGAHVLSVTPGEGTPAAVLHAMYGSPPAT